MIASHKATLRNTDRCNTHCAKSLRNGEEYENKEIIRR